MGDDRDRSRKRARSRSNSGSSVDNRDGAAGSPRRANGGGSRSRSRSRSGDRCKSSSRRKDRRRRSRSDSRERRRRSSSRDGHSSKRDRKEDRRRENGSGGKPKEDGPKAAEEPAKPNVLIGQPEAATGRSGGIYIPPFKLAQMRKDMGALDKSSREYQRLAWDALRKSINGLINKVNAANIKDIVPELFTVNLVRGRGLFARAVMKAQLASPGFTPVFAAIVAVVNTKLPENGELVLKRVIVAFRRAFKRRDKIVATALAKFIAHLVNQQVAHELLALQLLTVLLEEPTDDSVEIAVGFTREIGQLLQEVSPQGLHAVFERFRGILQEGTIDKRVQYTVEGLFATRKNGFADYPAVPKELDLVEREDQITFELGLDDELDKEELLDVFRMDDKYEDNEGMWDAIRAEILGEGSDDESGSEGSGGEGGGGGDGEDEEDEGEGEGEGENGAAAATGGGGGGGRVVIHDLTEQDLVNLRRTIYLTIMSSVSFEECCHKLAKLDIQQGYESELCNMLTECCSQERSYLSYYGLIAQRFCMMHRRWQEAFEDAFAENYSTIHRLETNKLRNVAKLFAHLLYTDALPWTCLEAIRVNEDDTTSSSRIFIKVLCQELSENLGLATLRQRFMDPYMVNTFSGMFPKDNPRNTRFAINFFTSIGLGGLTDDMRLHLKNAPKQIMAAAAAAQQQEEDAGAASDSSSSSSSSSSGSSSSGSRSGSGSSSSGSSSGNDSDSDSSSSSGSSSGGSARGSRSRRRR